MLGERADLLVPAPREHLVVHGVALGSPAGHVAGPAARGRHPDRAVERDPGLYPSVQEVLATAPRLPDPLVGLIPVLAQPVDEARDLEPALMGELHAVRAGEVERVHRLAVDVELELVRGPVADPHRLRTSPALQVREDLLRQIARPVHPVHDLQRPRRRARLLACPVSQPVGERRGLVGETEPEQ